MRSRALAWAVHVYTASGALLAFFAMHAVFREDYRGAFLLLFAAVVVDSTDGTLARLARVHAELPHFDGGRVDDVVDYLTFVFVPVVLVYRADLLPAGWGAAVASLVLLASAYGFGRIDAKTADHYFTGFPSYWNVVAFYLFAAGPPRVVNAVILIGLSMLVFVPLRYVYPSRTPAFRSLTVVLCSSWAAAMLVSIWLLPSPPRWLLILSLFFPIYYAVLSVVLHRRRGRGGSSVPVADL